MPTATYTGPLGRVDAPNLGAAGLTFDAGVPVEVSADDAAELVRHPDFEVEGFTPTDAENTEA